MDDKEWRSFCTFVTVVMVATGLAILAIAGSIAFFISEMDIFK